MEKNKRKNISRKDFLKRGTVAMGLLPVSNLLNHIPVVAGNTLVAQEDDINNGTGDTSTRIRGSWIQKQTAQPGDIVLVKDGKGCCIVVDKQEQAAVKQAAVFLAKDIQKITGYLPAVEEQPAAGITNIRLVTAGIGSLPSSIDVTSLQKQWEAHHVFTQDNDVWLIGADHRGTAFAAYTLSERIGIDPLYLWSGYEPVTYTTLVLKKTDFSVASPVFRFRGFFHDDEDILPRPFEANDYPLRIGDVPLEWYQRFFETALRLRMNMVAPYTRVRRRMEVQQCASDWGLFYTSHHYDILLSNPFGIERFGLAEKRKAGPDWDWYKNKTGMMNYWKGGVEENKDLYTIWPVGLRGTDDHAYTFPEGTSADEQAKVFQEAIQAQVAIVKESLPPAHPSLFHFTLYTEMLDKYNNQRGEFNLPEDVIIVWPDDNNGNMRALPGDRGKWKHGIYYHLAYFGGDNTKQVAHTVSPEVITTQFQKIIDAGATEFMLVNVSEMREFMMEGRLLSAICFDGKKANSATDTADQYIKWWAGEYFDAAAQADAEKLYKMYYRIFDKPTAVWMGNEAVQDILEQIYFKFTTGKYTAVNEKTMQSLEKRAVIYTEILKQVDTVNARLTRPQQQFLFEQLVIGLLFDARPVQAALLLAQALKENDRQKTWTIIDRAYNILAQLETEILRAERPPFEKWYRATWIKRQESSLNIHRPYDQLRAFIACNGTKTPVVERVKNGHNIEGAKVWADFLDQSEKLPNKIL